MTEKEYSDFILRFEFKLEDGSNNGLASRAVGGRRRLISDGKFRSWRKARRSAANGAS